MSKFDEVLDKGHIPSRFRESLICVNDTLCMAKVIAGDIFGDDVTNEDTIRVYKLIDSEYRNPKS